jgi:hypothetical protein
MHHDGEITESIVKAPIDSPLSIDPNKNNTKHILVKRIMYDYHGNLSPAIISTLNGKYIVPGWIKVHPEATLVDINWIREKIKPVEAQVFKFTSASMPGIEYKVTKIGTRITCTCQGYFRSGGNCKHVKEVRAKA